MVIKLKVAKNKRNNQLLVSIPRKKLDLKGKDPKFLQIKKEDLKF